MCAQKEMILLKTSLVSCIIHCDEVEKEDWRVVVIVEKVVPPNRFLTSSGSGYALQWLCL